MKVEMTLTWRGKRIDVAVDEDVILFSKGAVFVQIVREALRRMEHAKAEKKEGVAS